jgi:hypothetical protein
MLPIVALTSVSPKVAEPIPTSVPMKTSRTSLGDGGRMFSVYVIRKAAITTPHDGNDASDSMNWSSIALHNVW